VIGDFPIDLAGIQSLSPISFELRNLDVPGRSTVRGQIELELGRQIATVDLTGVEWLARAPGPRPASRAHGL